MIRFKKLTIKNFLSYGEALTEMNLDTIGTTLIVGEDLDNTASGTGGNGTGKSTWVNALIYGLYGKPISNISMDNLVNNINKKNMRVEVEFENNNEIVTIRRARKEKATGSYAKVFIRPLGTTLDEKEHDETPDSISNINDFIVDKLGIPFELFVRIVAFTATHTPFLDLPVRHASQANQSDIMEELFRLTQLSIKADLLKAEQKDTKQTLEIQTKHNDQLEKEHDRNKKQLESAQNRVDVWDIDQKNNITKTENELSDLESIPVEEQESLYKTLNSIEVALVKEKEKQKDIEHTITKISGEYTVIKTQLISSEDEKKKTLEWKNENIEKVAKYKKEADNLPDAHILSEQETLHENITLIAKKVEEYLTEQKEINIEIKNINKDLGTLDKEKIHLEDSKCPYCLQKYEGSVKKLHECENDIKDYQQDETKLTKLLDTVEQNITTEENILKDAFKQVQYDVKEIEKYERMRDDYVNKLEDLLNEQCPYDEQPYDINKLKETSIGLKRQIEKEADNLIAKDGIVDELEQGLIKCKDDIIIGSLDELYKIKNNISQYKTKVKELKSATNPFIEPLQELKDINIEKIDMDNINELNTLITHQNYLIKLLTKKDSFIRKTLLNKNLAFLNQRLQHYLTALGLPHRVEFTHEMTAKITQFGRELDFGNLSSGQKARVNIGLSFSFRDVLQKSHDSINVCMLDEVLDVGLDSVGVQSAARMLKRKAREEDLGLFIISHRDEVSGIFDNKMVVQMEKGFSSIKMENNS